METFRRLVSAGGRLPGVSLLLAGAAVCLQCSPAALEWLQYDRAAIAGGELWRIVTGHLTHASWNHLLWDAVALVVLGAICERDQRRSFVACLAASAIGLSLCLWLAMPELAIYRGLSGIDSAVFVFLAVVLLRQSLAAGQKWWSAGIVAVLCGFGLKVAFEYATGETLFVDSGAAVMTPVPLVHLVGGVIGAIVGVMPALVEDIIKSSLPTCRRNVLSNDRHCFEVNHAFASHGPFRRSLGPRRPRGTECLADTRHIAG